MAIQDQKIMSSITFIFFPGRLSVIITQLTICISNFNSQFDTQYLFYNDLLNHEVKKAISLISFSSRNLNVNIHIKMSVFSNVIFIWIDDSFPHFSFILILLRACTLNLFKGFLLHQKKKFFSQNVLLLDDGQRFTFYLFPLFIYLHPQQHTELYFKYHTVFLREGT